MNQQKGFSLVEVLVSLWLVTMVALFLLQQQWQSKQLLKQLIWREQSAQFLDQIDEALFAQLPRLPAPPPSYQLQMEHTPQGTVLRVHHGVKPNVLTRHHMKLAGSS
ncbi:MAG: prepilin-type N-terminal cleavage/methylation domain-containing protein [Legionella sp.]|uniref:PilW family protein n=1 Tax=Legionella sp. TaxID=459 RepID=UPI002851ECC3|nr:prepilin-type N-terminal cleavage/methylation domain-containing protein [Legionella sp.]